MCLPSAFSAVFHQLLNVISPTSLSYFGISIIGSFVFTNRNKAFYFPHFVRAYLSPTEYRLSNTNIPVQTFYPSYFFQDFRRF